MNYKKFVLAYNPPSLSYLDVTVVKRVKLQCLSMPEGALCVVPDSHFNALESRLNSFLFTSPGPVAWRMGSNEAKQ
ncbi:hypothetical protein M2387_001078 [Klebsiella sp. BIGb0407]|nr:hypothetical protein [Klebsiella sp. BIGb0407]